MTNFEDLKNKKLVTVFSSIGNIKNAKMTASSDNNNNIVYLTFNEDDQYVTYSYDRPNKYSFYYDSNGSIQQVPSNSCWNPYTKSYTYCGDLQDYWLPRNPYNIYVGDGETVNACNIVPDYSDKVNTLIMTLLQRIISLEEKLDSYTSYSY